jgi:hypothetical protein
MRLHGVSQFQPRHARPYRAYARAVRQRTGARHPGVRRWPGRWLVLGRAQVHLPGPGQLPDDPACPGRGRVVGGLLRGAAGVPAPRTDAPAAGGSGRARARNWARPRWKATRSTLAASASTRPAVMWAPSSFSRHTDSGASARPPAGAAASPAGLSAASFPDLARSLLPGFGAVLAPGGLPSSRRLAGRNPAALRDMLAASLAN